VREEAMEHVSLVRVENEWHVFSNTRAAWDFYKDWAQYRDCEFLGECPIDASLPIESESV
jgi:hypothetical protein